MNDKKMNCLIGRKVAGLNMKTLIPVIAWLLTLAGSHARGDDFVQFRGTNAGVIADQQIPMKWSSDEHLAWKVPVPGSGWSQPVLWQNRVYITSAVSDPPLRPKNFSDGVKTPQSMGLGD